MHCAAHRLPAPPQQLPEIEDRASRTWCRSALRCAPIELTAPASPLPRESCRSGRSAAAGDPRVLPELCRNAGEQGRGERRKGNPGRTLLAAHAACFRPVGANAILSDPFPLLWLWPPGWQVGLSVCPRKLLESERHLCPSRAAHTHFRCAHRTSSGHAARSLSLPLTERVKSH